MRNALFWLLLIVVALAIGGTSVLKTGTAQAQQQLPATHFGAPDSGQALTSGMVTGFSGARAARNPQAPDARPVGQQVCTACHAKEADNFAHSTHALGMETALKRDGSTATCEACHGPGSTHARNPTQPGQIIAFTKKGGTPVETQAATCMACHSGGPRDHWLGSVHQRNGLSCSDCHNPMTQVAAEGLTAKQSINQTCATCHNDIRQQFNRRSHMPLPEGQMACVDCHNPHGTLNASLVKTDTVNETCYQCHAEKRGPFLFEHAPVRDNCLNCHTPHGSNQHALLVAPMPMLCQQCHSHMRHPNDLMTTQQLASGAGPNERAMGRACISCHAQIHGSNSPSGPRLHR
ncbi:DmsE family decaheme c-type cytochrome [Aerolutibacter ruishenii]|uniref:DmsE family decaheme c-type cytochrome n=1 Tax=Aerolutibacter ruishenii TaxID=686800 RepID=A0A562LHX4_9GAMM|nr:DmsE family decaheme c-type cytochrome [Lysobacter ruishenii]TWI07222.1 DmsE family decaheme c-type cytochrome [Lysobacter ruishenii]